MMSKSFYYELKECAALLFFRETLVHFFFYKYYEDIVTILEKRHIIFLGDTCRSVLTYYMDSCKIFLHKCDTWGIF